MIQPQIANSTQSGLRVSLAVKGGAYATSKVYITIENTKERPILVHAFPAVARPLFFEFRVGSKRLSLSPHPEGEIRGIPGYEFFPLIQSVRITKVIEWKECAKDVARELKRVEVKVKYATSDLIYGRFDTASPVYNGVAVSNPIYVRLSPGHVKPEK